MFQSGFVSILGRPNVGKSTLLNAIIGEKLAIMSNKPQTTRHAIHAIYNDPFSQIIFVDTPGVHKPKNKLGTFMVETALSSIDEVDLILFMVDNSTTIGPGDQFLIDLVKQSNTPCVAVINKVDLMMPEVFVEVFETYQNMAVFADVIGISASQSKGIAELMTKIKSYLPEGPAYYPVDQFTDETERQIVAELIREKALHYLNDEVPHGIAVEIVSMKQRTNKPLLDIQANIIAEKKSHKSIIIGKGGRKLKGIGMSAREEIERLVDTKVNLQLFVKVRDHWRDNATLLKELGYKK